MARRKRNTPNPSTDQAERWRNRIVGMGSEAPDQLLANPLNFRVHSTEQRNALAGALQTVGWIQLVIVNQRTGHVVDGHLRVQLALQRKEPAVPVLYVDLDDNEERVALATLDPIAALAGTDEALLVELLASIEVQDEQLAEFLAELAPQTKEPTGGSSPAPEAITVWGELIRMGRHRVLCGDITDDAHRTTVQDGTGTESILDLVALACVPLIDGRKPRTVHVIVRDPFDVDALVDAWQRRTGDVVERVPPSA